MSGPRLAIARMCDSSGLIHVAEKWHGDSNVSSAIETHLAVASRGPDIINMLD